MLKSLTFEQHRCKGKEKASDINYGYCTGNYLGNDCKAEKHPPTIPKKTTN